VKFSRKFNSVPCQPSGRCGIPSGRSSVSNIRPDDEIFPSGSLLVLEASNSSSLHPSGRNGKSSGRSSEFEKILVFQHIRPDDLVILSGRHSVFDKH
jgi:hypothetical protein